MIIPLSLRKGYTFAYLIADNESTAQDNPATPVAKNLLTSVSCKAISSAS